MEKIVLKATRRDTTKTAKAIRREGILPAVMYGRHFESTPISLDAHSAGLALMGLSSSAIINIDLEGQTHAALVREKQKDYLRNQFIHVDFQVVSLTEKIRATVNIVIEGVSPAVKDFNGVVVHNVNEVDVEALPQYLPEHIVVDISGLAHIGDALHIRDLKIAKEVEVLEDLDEVVVVISATKEETEVVASELAEPEVIERGKKEEEKID